MGENKRVLNFFRFVSKTNKTKSQKIYKYQKAEQEVKKYVMKHKRLPHIMELHSITGFSFETCSRGISRFVKNNSACVFSLKLCSNADYKIHMEKRF